MAWIIRDINLGLFILIIATVIAFAGFTVYYKETFTNLSIDYHTKLKELQRVTTTLESEKARLNLTSYQLKIKAERETDLSTKYETIRDEKEKLDKEKAELQAELIKTKSDLAEKSNQLSITKDELLKKSAELSSANREIAGLNSQVSTLSDEVKTKEERIKTLCNKLTTLGETC